MLRRNIYKIGAAMILSSILMSFEVKDSSDLLRSELIAFKILDTGDTINRLTFDSVKLGKWFEDFTENNNYFYRIGEYQENLKEGVWRVYNNLDDKIEETTYLRGAKNGRQAFFERGRVIAFGNNIGFYFSQNKDTILVTDPRDYKDYETEVDNVSYDLRDGRWLFFNPYTGDTTRMIEYNYGHVIDEVDYRIKENQERDSVIIKNLPNNQENYKPIKKKPRKYYFPK